MKTVLMALVLFATAVSQATVEINSNGRRDGSVQFDVITLSSKGLFVRTELGKAPVNNFQFNNDVIKAVGLSKKELMDLIKENTNSRNRVLRIDVTMGETNVVKSIDYVSLEKAGQD